jgi:nicotinamidase-related amidase
MMIERNKSAILLIDMQARLVPYTEDHKTLEAHCQWMLGIAKYLNIPVYTSQQYPEKLGQTISLLQDLIDPKHIIDKIAFSVMRDPKGLEMIKSSGKTHWILMGIESHVCVFQSAIEMKAAGLDVFVLEQATQSRYVHDKVIAMERMREAGIHIVSREMVSFEWLRVAGTPEFKYINEHFIK